MKREHWNELLDQVMKLRREDDDAGHDQVQKIEGASLLVVRTCGRVDAISVGLSPEATAFACGTVENRVKSFYDFGYINTVEG